MDSRRLRLTLWGVIAILGFTGAKAEVRLPNLFQNHMVLQQETTCPVWGWAEPGEKIQIQVAGQTKTVQTGEDSKWRVFIDPMEAGGPYTVTVKGRASELVLEDVLVGEVWLCSGQSNMAMTVSGAMNSEEEAAAATLPAIRMATIARKAAGLPQENCDLNGWMVCSPQTVPQFSATAYYFGRHLHQKLDVPVGLINASWGGTRIETWMSRASLMELESGRAELDKMKEEAVQYDPEKAEKAFQKRKREWKAEGSPPKKRPPLPAPPDARKNAAAAQYHAMIAPLVPYAVRGAIWYQGERNANLMKDAYEYRKELPQLIEGWRKAWDRGDFPFLFVQLPNFGGKDGNILAVNRESMLLSLATENTGMAVTIDIGDTKDIHPKNKQDVGKRLGLLARSLAYGENLVSSGPLYESMEIMGGTVAIRFDHGGSKLTGQEGNLEGFTIAGKDKVFLEATAKIEGDRVIVRNDRVTNPKAVRYAWGGDPPWSLTNEEGLPASPFRTDNWEVMPSRAKAE